MPRMQTTLVDAWDAIRAVTPAGWYVGRPTWNDGQRVWEQYALDPRERAHYGVRSREWTAVAGSKVGVVREMARCLALIRDGRVPG